jgi:hypothetical protein
MRLIGRHSALAATALLLASGTLAAQDAPQKPPLEIPGDGTELFRGLLDHFGIKPISKLELGRLNRFEDVILISLGNLHLRPDNVGGLDYFPQTSNIGSALIASDTWVMLNSNARTQQGIEGSRVYCADAKAGHRDEKSCPYIVPIDDGGEGTLRRVFRGLRRVATNSPSYISVSGWGGNIKTALARFPRDCETRREILPADALFAVGGEGPDLNNDNPYRLLVMADHSIFINQMLLEPQTDNLELTYRVIEFLQGPDKKRKRCIFFEDGRQIETFDDLRQAYAKQNPMPLPQVNLMAMQEKLTDLGNAIVDRLQINNAHNNLILGSDRNSSLTIIARFLLILAAVTACFFLIRRLWQSRKPSDIPPPPAVAAASTGPPGVFDRRQKELLRRDNLLEPVRDLVRDFFASIGIHAEPGDRMPKIVIADVVRKPDSLRMAVKDFWILAYGPPHALSINRWRELEPFFERLQKAHAEGKWRFVVAATPASTAGSLA